MGVYHTFSVTCPNCNTHFDAALVNAVNITRFPDMKSKVLDRTLNQVRCPTCSYSSVVEKSFFYTDVKGGLNITVYPRKERHFHKEAADETNRLFSSFDRTQIADIRPKRVVFGLEELREKVVAHDAGILDDALELLKVYLLNEHPFLLDKTKLRVTLDHVETDKLTFNATSDQEKNYFKLYIPRVFYEAIVPPAPAAEPRRVAPSAPLQLARRTFADGSGANWVNLWKLNPGNDALAALSATAEAVRKQQPVNLDDPAVTRMLNTLPPGSQLPAWAKGDLQTISDFAQRMGRADIEEKLFRVRFGFGVMGDWHNDQGEPNAIWSLLKSLPDIAAAGNTWISAMYVDATQGGVYDPSTKEIHIGSGIQTGTSAFRNVVLHEVGHSVQEKLDREKGDLVTKWLLSEFGWNLFEPDTKGIDQWIAALGGYPAGTSEQAKIQVRSYIQQSIGAGKTFDQPPIVNGPTGSLWNKPDFAPRQAFKQSKSNWWTSCDSYYRHGSNCFFVNYYYAKLMQVKNSTVDLIVAAMPDRYAAMSQFEFFAELFAWYYDAQTGKRDKIPQAASGWMLANVGALDLSAPFAPPRPPPPRRNGSGGQAEAKRPSGRRRPRR
jgi:hypothetical protein